MSGNARRVGLAFAAIVVPVALMVGFSILAQLTSKLVGSGLGLVLLYPVELLVGAAVIVVFLRWMARLRSTGEPWLGTGRGFGWGFAAGLVASIGSGILFYLAKRPTLADPLTPVLRPSRAISNIGTAAIEEASFRAGVVQIVASAWGPWAGLVAGSVPFGALHLLNILFGSPPSLAHVIGVSAGGWLLSLLYLRFGLTAAFACHWVWNSLATNWVRAFQLPRKSRMVLFEGAWTTDLVLVLMCGAIHWLKRSTEEKTD
jgi:membrane protease YdiL (CAAX protease family)